MSLAVRSLVTAPAIAFAMVPIRPIDAGATIACTIPLSTAALAVSSRAWVTAA
jgi:hypothetical protein